MAKAAAGLPWYKCDPVLFNEGMVGLTAPERGAYATLINAMYAAGGPVKDDPFYWSGTLLCTPKQWEGYRAALIRKGRLTEVDLDGRPCLIDDKARRVLADHDEYRRRMGELSAAGVDARAAKKAAGTIRSPHGHHAVTARSPHDNQHGNQSKELRVKTEEEHGGARSRARPKLPLSDDWRLSENDTAHALAAGFKAADITRMFERFRNHAQAQDRRCADWHAAWRNWVNKDLEARPKPKKAEVIW